ncbi:monoamine oxidase [Fusarium circinatum]|uniref:monoamine oxidase n=1 Tax=Fusarium circinatum TaxID=48490 RepID=A0A8H5UB81_FUSCI|nr:monoamine oxidase [Fusarium circinatum]
MLDLLIIGAGVSGLQAAVTAQKAGLSIAILEARDRVGGKSWTVPLQNTNGKADLGIAWVNDELQPLVWSYIQQFGLTDQIVKQRLGHKAVMVSADGERIEFPFGITPDFTAEEKKNLEMVRDYIQADSLKPHGFRKEDDQISLDQYVRNLGGGPKTLAMVNLWVRVMHGLESTEESAAWFIEYCRTNHGLLAIREDDRTGGNYMRLKSGTQSIAQGIAHLIGYENIHLSNPVSSIEQTKSDVTVRTITGKAIKAKKLIISMPSALLKKLTFSPPLPERAQEPWWRDGGFNGFFMDFRGPAGVVRDTSFDDEGIYGFTCFVNGKPGGKWSKKTPETRRKIILDQLAYAFDSSEAYNSLEFVEQVWQNEEFSRGALAPVTKVGHLA